MKKKLFNSSEYLGVFSKIYFWKRLIFLFLTLLSTWHFASQQKDSILLEGGAAIIEFRKQPEHSYILLQGASVIKIDKSEPDLLKKITSRKKTLNFSKKKHKENESIARIKKSIPADSFTSTSRHYFLFENLKKGTILSNIKQQYVADITTQKFKIFDFKYTKINEASKHSDILSDFRNHQQGRAPPC